MNQNTLFVIGTLSHWAGWICLLRLVYLCARWLRPLHPDERPSILRGICLASGITVLLFAGGILLPGVPMLQSGYVRLPVFWPVLSASLWLLMGSLLYGLYRLSQILTTPDKSDKASHFRTSVVCLVFAVICFLIARKFGYEAEILKGKIELSSLTISAFLSIAILGVVAMVWTAKLAKTRTIFKNIVLHITLTAGSIAFGIPFVWLLLTSFKEDRDMVAKDGLVWIPRVQQTLPYLDPDDPLIEAKYQGRSVVGSIIERRENGMVKIEIIRPQVFRGRTVAVQPPLKTVPRDAPIMTFEHNGLQARGYVIKDLDEVNRRLKILEPQNLEGQIVEKKLVDLEPDRKVGLRTQNYIEALEFLPPETYWGLIYIRNTLILVITNVIGTLLASSLVAYAFARLKFPGKNVIFSVLLATMMLPGAVTLLPTFLIFRSLGMVDTLYPLIIPAFFGSAFNIFLLRQFFMGIPLELEDAAKIDGCSHLRSYWSVMLPQIKPALAVIAIWTTMGAWNNFMYPLIFINSPEIMPIGYATQLFQGDRAGEPGLLMAFATMGMLPILLLFIFAQKFFIEGVTLSGLGGR